MYTYTVSGRSLSSSARDRHCASCIRVDIVAVGVDGLEIRLRVRAWSGLIDGVVVAVHIQDLVLEELHHGRTRSRRRSGIRRRSIAAVASKLRSCISMRGEEGPGVSQRATLCKQRHRLRVI